MLRSARPRTREANARLAKLAPKEFALGDARHFGSIGTSMSNDSAPPSPRADSFDMRQALKYWRKDLNGIQSGVVLVITPVQGRAHARPHARLLPS